LSPKARLRGKRGGYADSIRGKQIASERHYCEPGELQSDREKKVACYESVQEKKGIHLAQYWGKKV